MTIFLTGDLHGYRGLKRLCRRCRRNVGLEIGEGDYVIILGDFGLIWSVPPEGPELRWLTWLSEKPWTTLFVDGNHENHAFISDFPIREWHGGKVHRIRNKVYHLMRGYVFDINGMAFFAMGGAASIDKKLRTPYESWWPEEIPNDDERRRALASLDACDWKVDYVLTHCPPTSVLLRVPLAHHEMDEYSDWLEDQILGRLEFRKWFFGHMHDNIMFDEGRFELLFDNVYDLDEGAPSYGGRTLLIDSPQAVAAAGGSTELVRSRPKHLLPL